VTDDDTTIIGLFPLGIVLLPGEVVPLRIFEERYKLLVNERRDGESEFGVVLAEEDGVREVGCTAVVVEVLEELEDGRMNILVEGRRRFRLLDLVQPDDPETEYIGGVVVVVADDDEGAEPPVALVRRAREAFRKMLVLMDVESPREPGGQGPLAYRIAAAVDFGTALKQELLESLSESARLETLTAVMETLLPRLELRKEREEAIRGNGKGY
jgi:Lon protease-like protein